ncbi:hypothetical protein R1sor_019899 [Riccia sorocarpa]|uniref:Uncharacterized protein n=1 Tax=Riccia sorocarpa TaxID=122646 RepID=A0ABD3II69_9MARC
MDSSPSDGRRAKYMQENMFMHLEISNLRDVTADLRADLDNVHGLLRTRTRERGEAQLNVVSISLDLEKCRLDLETVKGELPITQNALKDMEDLLTRLSNLHVDIENYIYIASVASLVNACYRIVIPGHARLKERLAKDSAHIDFSLVTLRATRVIEGSSVSFHTRLFIMTAADPGGNANANLRACIRDDIEMQLESASRVLFTAETRMAKVVNNTTVESAKRFAYLAHANSQKARFHIKRAMKLVNFILSPDDESHQGMWTKRFEDLEADGEERETELDKIMCTCAIPGGKEHCIIHTMYK